MIYQLQNCELCREWSHRELYENNLSLLFVLKIALFQIFRKPWEHLYRVLP